ncbi:unnamed protein product [Rotaria sordida]|uniref:Uncharacterized protein n=1 Tax=Rotaria sordida TaxID=392033 RepID=A0A819DV94_9BILA|nr:unnamed protein product [Rotaria sordida]CAF3839784.1 unnamed protein product [Rotaria sordida]
MDHESYNSLNKNYSLEETEKQFQPNINPTTTTFKKLESYTQGENQSFYNFYNKVLQLCNEADSTMSGSIKFKNILNKTKLTIQFEVRRKKSTTAKKILEYVKDIEELYQLSNISIHNKNNNIVTIPTVTKSKVNNYNNFSFIASQSQHWGPFDYNYYINNNKNNFHRHHFDQEIQQFHQLNH